ncbi:hypothetical protein FOL47_005949 [Perkinsus chesapeaki]|uniref:Uncharacterized protein n=1 Tax=Perkinsus chesapeaki TaxID=330153 RepID=A0A7J6MY57_PERCH|nr:hypothetical protein FOL47_005949 [Perkinsus chesapeaki]
MLILLGRSKTVSSIRRKGVRHFAPRRQSKKDLYKLEFMDHIETGVNPARIPMQFLYQKVEDQPPKELAYTIHTAARLRVNNKELFNKAIAAAADMANEMKPSYTVGILFGTLWIAKHWPANTNDVKVLYSAVCHRDIHRLQGVDIAYLLKAASAFSEECGTLCRPELTRLVQMISKTIPTSNVRSVTECLGAMAKLKITNEEALISVSRELTYQMESVRLVDIPTIFRSYVNLLPLMPQPLTSPSPHQAVLEAACSSLCARISLMEVEQISITTAALGKLHKFNNWWKPSGAAITSLAMALGEHLPLLQAEMVPSLMLNLGLASDNAPTEARVAIDTLLRRMASTSIRGVRNQTSSALASTIYAAETLPALQQDRPSLVSLATIHLQRKLTTTTIESLAGILGNIPSNTVRRCIANHIVQRLDNNLCKIDDYVRIGITAGVEGNREVSNILISAADAKEGFPRGALLAIKDAAAAALCESLEVRATAMFNKVLILGPTVLVKMKALKSTGAKERLVGLCRAMGFEAVDLSEKFSNNLHQVAAATEGDAETLIQPPGQVQMATLVGNPMPVIAQANVVDGMQVVAGLRKVQIRELRQMIEAITGFDQRNKYIIKDEYGREVFYAVEESNFCERNCYPADCAPWDLHIYVLGSKGIHGDLIHWLTVHRPCSCTCLCANRPVAYVTETSTDQLLGTLHDPYACCDLTFKIKDAADIHYRNKSEVGKIDKYWMWGDCCPICFKEQDNYWVTFGQVENPRWKALLLALGIFMDFRYFTPRNQKDDNAGASITVSS